MSEASLALEPWAFAAQGVTGAAIERPFEGVLEDPAMDCLYLAEANVFTKRTSHGIFRL